MIKITDNIIALNVMPSAIEDEGARQWLTTGEAVVRDRQEGVS